MNLAVIGSGGREHALCYKLKQSQKVKKLICIPGNAGTQKIATNIKEDISDFEALYQIIKKQEIDIVVVGPEQPLVDGIVDFLNEKKVRVLDERLNKKSITAISIVCHEIGHAIQHAENYKPLEQRNKINRLKYYGQKNQKEWMKSLIGQKFVLNLNLDRHNK